MLLLLVYLYQVYIYIASLPCTLSVNRRFRRPEKKAALYLLSYEWLRTAEVDLPDRVPHSRGRGPKINHPYDGAACRGQSHPATIIPFVT